MAYAFYLASSLCSYCANKNLVGRLGKGKDAAVFPSFFPAVFVPLLAAECLAGKKKAKAAGNGETSFGRRTGGQAHGRTH